jgi:hypothetical protein
MTQKLTQKQKTDIQVLLSQKKTPEEIAKEVGLTPAKVTAYVDGELSDILDTLVKVRLEQHAAKNPTKPAKTKVKKVNPLVNTTKNGKKGVSIMTEAASGRGDAQRERGIKPVHQDHIFIINPDKKD